MMCYARSREIDAIVAGHAYPIVGDGRQFPHAWRKLPNFMVPLQVEIRPTLPRNPNGKIDRKQLGLELIERFQ